VGTALGVEDGVLLGTLLGTLLFAMDGVLLGTSLRKTLGELDTEGIEVGSAVGSGFPIANKQNKFIPIFVKLSQSQPVE